MIESFFIPLAVTTVVNNPLSWCPSPCLPHQGLRRKKAEAEASVVRGMPTWHAIVPEPARELTFAFPPAQRPICAGRLELATSQRELVLRAAARPFAVGSIRTAHFAQAMYLCAAGQVSTHT